MYPCLNLNEMEVLVIDNTKEKYEYPSPIPLKGKAARYINIPASLIFDLQTDAKDLAAFTFLSVKRSVDDSVTFSLPDGLVKWNGFTPNRSANKINQKFIESLEKLKEKGYISDITKSSSWYTLTFNSQKVYDECQEYSFAVLYVDEIEKVIQHRNTDGDKYLNIPVLLFMLMFFRNSIIRRPNKIRQKEDNVENRRLLFPEAYNDKFVNISKKLGVPPRTVAKATSILEELGLIVTDRSYNVRIANDEFRTQDIIFANPYKREGSYLLDDSPEYSRREIKNKEKKIQQYNSNFVINENKRKQKGGN